MGKRKNVEGTTPVLEKRDVDMDDDDDDDDDVSEHLFPSALRTILITQSG